MDWNKIISDALAKVIAAFKDWISNLGTAIVDALKGMWENMKSNLGLGGDGGGAPAGPGTPWNHTIAPAADGGGGSDSGGHGVAGHNKLVTLTSASGKRYTINAAHQSNFAGFVSDLEAKGYKINSIAGYNYRDNVNNPGHLSLHACGDAIDINLGKNPNSAHGLITDMPSDIRDIAHRHGLRWGGDFHGHKDAMHFEYNRGFDSMRYHAKGPEHQSENHIHVHIDGKQVAHVVQKHAAKMAQFPTTAPYFDGSRSFTSPDHGLATV